MATYEIKKTVRFKELPKENQTFLVNRYLKDIAPDDAAHSVECEREYILDELKENPFFEYRYDKRTNVLCCTDTSCALCGFVYLKKFPNAEQNYPLLWRYDGALLSRIDLSTTPRDSQMTDYDNDGTHYEELIVEMSDEEQMLLTTYHPTLSLADAFSSEMDSFRTDVADWAETLCGEFIVRLREVEEYAYSEEAAVEYYENNNDDCTTTIYQGEIENVDEMVLNDMLTRVKKELERVLNEKQEVLHGE